MPHFGQEANNELIKFGAPPEVVYLSAYASNNSQRNLYRIPVVVNQLSIPYPSEVDYIQTETGEPFPTLMTIDMNLTETHSPSAYSKFNLADYRKGNLSNF